MQPQEAALAPWSSRNARRPRSASVALGRPQPWRSLEREVRKAEPKAKQLRRKEREIRPKPHRDGRVAHLCHVSVRTRELCASRRVVSRRPARRRICVSVRRRASPLCTYLQGTVAASGTSRWGTRRARRSAQNCCYIRPWRDAAEPRRIAAPRVAQSTHSTFRRCRNALFFSKSSARTPAIVAAARVRAALSESAQETGHGRKASTSSPSCAGCAPKSAPATGTSSASSLTQKSAGTAAAEWPPVRGA